MSLVTAIIVGLVAGALAGYFVKGGSFGIFGNIMIGIIGGVIGNFVFGFLGLQTDGSIVGDIFVAFIGAAILLLIVRAFSTKNSHSPS